ncbi:hypothetical protein [Nocardioides zhouii]|uniref:Uncharacterized protein n=1 Tax=Nocardioides zhouii TaxID=1168729 RepID=A0A4Q2T2H2_9ACTN|nr:hypothetical protein [Nocardioides zhouii]RYC11134.1 hypothetical protein EUA94_11055 [Nocardioides zhouii]
MSPETDLLTRLDRELDALPAVPATTYLLEGRRARRRRRVAAAVTAPAAAAAALALVAALGQGGAGDEAQLAQEPTSVPELTNTPTIDYSADPDFVAPLPNNPLEAQDGLDGIDWFTTDAIPSWAQEYGNHGPVAMSPEGRLWVAPDAAVRRVIVDPFTYGEAGTARSYAVEATCACAPEQMTDGIVWVWLSADGSGVMDIPGRWTDDFELWVDDATASQQGRPSFAERLVQFADDTTSEVRSGSPDVRIVRSELDPELGPDWVQHRRAAAVEVVSGGQTWYAVAVDPGDGGPWSQAYRADVAPDFEGFLDLIAQGYL